MTKKRKMIPEGRRPSRRAFMTERTCSKSPMSQMNDAQLKMREISNSENEF